ncbi:MAG: Asp23/Gls24 family envelope stress response protein [Clostridiaceae bacterium]|jgi:uncharacterized alkaline shock family protein YloU|nr:Asp23/Gls24 family envelope stress response protein [Clostridiaceae bacterium]
MSLVTSNIFGKISISDEAVAIAASQAASECYGVAELVSRRLSDSFTELLNRKAPGKGVKVHTIENLIYIDVYVTLILGVNVEAVKSSIESTVRYSVGTFTGMRVQRVGVNVVGIKV